MSQTMTIDEQRRLFEKEREEFERRIQWEEQRLQREKELFDMKLRILEEELQKFAKDKERFEQQKAFYERVHTYEVQEKCQNVVRGEMFFIGVENQDTLKKRYKDLLKIYHPDNEAGDTSTIQEINNEYKKLCVAMRA